MSFIVREATPTEADLVIEFLLNHGSDLPATKQADSFREFLAVQNLEPTWTLVISKGDQVCGGAVAIVSPGRTAMVLIGCQQDAQLARQLGFLLEEISQLASEQRLQLLHVLLAPGQSSESIALDLAGFQRIADLEYRARAVSPADVLPDHDWLVPQTYSEANHAEFLRALELSYHQSLDCPGLNQVRQIEDIVATHRSTGIHDPNLWFIFQDSEAHTAAVLLLTQVPMRRALEVIYVGVDPEFRGQGIGNWVTQFALGQAALRSLNHVLLAVDSNNCYARDIYDALGFLVTDHRHAWIRSIADPG